MSVLDILYTTIILSLIVTTVFVNMILYQVYRAMRNMRKSTERVFSISQNILRLQKQAKLAVLKPVYRFLTLFKKSK